jgi:hypothetical protein
VIFSSSSYLLVLQHSVNDEDVKLFSLQHSFLSYFPLVLFKVVPSSPPQALNSGMTI